ncbi:methyl-accepting chemotaxis protein [Peteryoungia desertarenae]|uniref:Methyl-accepting chemotaxis protein n=1 Tax=Peteryoungia desertarenae TaxID=1813451 RepID=A0ABX6QRC7_9HYPH|nr:methyl-accepting chemotaxis protein [Peteryoungia desertarenae]QLF71164.1 methyl-accepting chemotaxis protein [Peteryoungia desertarenae]
MAARLNSLSSKVIGLFLLLTVVTVALLNVFAYRSSNAEFAALTEKSMVAALTFRGDMLSEQLKQIENQANSIAKIESLQQSLTGLKSGWNTITKNSGDAKSELQRVFVSENPFPAGEREKLVKPEGPSGFYYSTHETTQVQVGDYLRNTAFSDMLILDQSGNVLYSYRKGPSFAENVTTGPLAASGLGKVFALSVEAAEAAVDDVAAITFSGLSVGANAATPEVYFAVPVVKFESFKGVFVFQVDANALSRILSKGIVPGSTEQTAILSADGTGIALGGDGSLVDIKSADFNFPANPTVDQIFSSEITRNDGAAKAFGRAVMFNDQVYVVAESISHTELAAGSMRIAQTLMITGLLALLALAFATGFLMKRLFAPLAALTQFTGEVADGKLDNTVPNQHRGDEIGRMARALERFRLGLIEQQRQSLERREERERVELERRQRMTERDAEAATLQQVVEVLDEGLGRLAKGDLSFKINHRFPDALESLRANFNNALATLSQTLSGIGGNSVAVRAGSEEMRAGADQLAERTERQAIAVSEAANAIKEITDAVQVQISRAAEAEKIARHAKQDTEHSGLIMGDTISAMEAIQCSSQEINKIIGVIDEIAFQTNLLALNAGVEAARAGESGKGFAVVAQEVRALAQRSSTAAKEISDLLAKSTVEVENGVSLVEKAGAALNGIGAHVLAINSHISEIMESTREEAETLGHIHGSVGKLDTMTQQNAALVEETTAAIHKLAQEAAEMDQQLGQFTLDNQPGKFDGMTASRQRMAG